jgi:hypothetical protein
MLVIWYRTTYIISTAYEHSRNTLGSLPARRLRNSKGNDAPISQFPRHKHVFSKYISVQARQDRLAWTRVPKVPTRRTGQSFEPLTISIRPCELWLNLYSNRSAYNVTTLDDAHVARPTTKSLHVALASGAPPPPFRSSTAARMEFATCSSGCSLAATLQYGDTSSGAAGQDVPEDVRMR